MKKYLKIIEKIIWCLCFLSIISCKNENDRIEEEALQRTIGILMKQNALDFHRAEQSVIDDGNDEYENSVLIKVKSLLELKTTYDLSAHEDVSKFIQEFEKETMGFVNKPPSNNRGEQPIIEHDIDLEFYLLKNHFDAWNDESSYQELIIKEDILRIEHQILKVCFQILSIRNTIIDYFHGWAHFYSNYDTISQGKEWKGFIGISSDGPKRPFVNLNYDRPNLNFYLSKADKKPIEISIEFEIERYGNNAWMVNFTPIEPGIYTVNFTLNLTSQLYKGQVIEQYQGFKEIIVK
jgi:hypothetical protein